MKSDDHAVRPPSSRTFLSLLGDLKDDCLILGRQRLKLLEIQISDRTDKIKRFTAIAVVGVALGLSGLVVFLIGLSNWVALAFGPASIPDAAGHTLVGLLCLSAGSLTTFLALKSMPDGSPLATPDRSAVRPEMPSDQTVENRI